MNRNIVRKKPRGRVKRRERMPKLKPQRGPTSAPASAVDGDCHGTARCKAAVRTTNGNGVGMKHAAKAEAKVTEKSQVSPSKAQPPIGPPSSADGAVTPVNGPLATDLLARVRQAALAVPDAKFAEVDEATGLLKRIVSRALGRGRGMDERERKAVLVMLCEEVKPVLLRYELVLEGLSFLERLRMAKTRGAVVSARLNLKGLIASLTA